MKLTQKEALVLLSAAGVKGAEIVTEDADSEFNQDKALQSIDAARSEILKPKWQQELGDKASTDASGKLIGVITSKLVKATGIRRAELDKIENLEERIEAAIAYKDGLKDGDKADVEKKLNEILAKHSEDTDSIKREYEGKLAEVNQKYTAKELKDWAFSQLKDAPILDTADKSVAAQDFYKHLSDKYHVSYDEAARIGKLYQKDNPSMPALNAAGTAGIDLMNEAKEYFEPRGMWQKDFKHKSAADELAKYTKDSNYVPNAKPSGDVAADFNQAFAKVAGG